MAGGGGSGGGGTRVVMVVVVVVVMMVMASPVLGQTDNGGVFHLYKSCVPSDAASAVQPLSHLVPNNTMWLRPTREEVTLIPLENTTKAPCVLPPNITHQVRVRVNEILVSGAAGEEEEAAQRECFFPRRAVFGVPRGVLRVSCLPEKSQAEAEMLEAEESSSPAPATVRPQPRALDPSSARDTTQHFTTTRPPPSPQEPIEQPSTATQADHLQTTVMVTGTAASTKPPPPPPPPLTDDTTMKTTPMQGTSTTLASSSSTHHTHQADTPSPPPRTQQSHAKKANISVRELATKINIPHSGERGAPSEPDDQVIYLAGAGAAVVALVMCVVAVAGVAHHRRRQARAKEAQQDLFISGAHKGSMHSLAHSDSHGAYLNAHEMYSGAEPEYVESFEMEERVLNSTVSYSSHDIPKCLREPCD